MEELSIPLMSQQGQFITSESMVEWAVSKGFDFRRPLSDLRVSAALGDLLDVLQWSQRQSPRFNLNEDVLCHAARGGRLMVLQWLRAPDPPCP